MRKSGSRHVAREYALRVLYSYEVLKKSGEENPVTPDLHWWRSEDNLSVIKDADTFAKKLYNGVEKDLEQLDTIIQKHAHNWRLIRMASVDRNILRLSIFEMLHFPETESNIILDEALELAKCYGNEDSVRFVNGILDSVCKEHRK